MRTWRRSAEPYLFIMPSLVLKLVFGVYPILWALRFMFYDYKGYGEPVFSGLANFERLMRDKLFWESVLNTFVYAGGKLLFTIPLALVLAVILNGKLRGRQLLRGVYFMPTVVSTAVMSVVFYIIFNSYNGLLNQVLKMTTVISEPLDWLGTDLAMFTAILVAAWGAIGNNMLLFLAGLQGIPKDVLESAEIDGANSWQRFRYITVPMLGPVLQIIMMLAIITALKGYESIMVLTGGGPAGKTEVMYLYMYKLLFPVSTGESIPQDIGYGSAVGFVSAIIVGLITAAYFYYSKKTSRIY
ncbi:carbohydrate ABC transporter permease [Cohnella phaseoli]|uniref:Raffinose/stachyose/melibiose transport system permease protein n=1 Tax=Cohnella phaseoli TaxID=456490 RepID=A0A3D9KPQ8_9BACL|nr:sugar ABC transporter permease [Cohnella phaseoli]RED87564.1 raffinose/stachyose/melibiose transport system permease protein [Cohnella phaseoli]